MQNQLHVGYKLFCDNAKLNMILTLTFEHDFQGKAPYSNHISQLTWHPLVLSGHSECDEGSGLTIQAPHQHDGSGATADVEVHHSITRCGICDGVGDNTPGTGVRVYCRHLCVGCGVCKVGRYAVSKH